MFNKLLSAFCPYPKAENKPQSKPKKQRYYIPQKQQINGLCQDILENPHTLIGGTTGSGKSVLLNSIISAFLTNYGVNNRLFLIDPKRVELSIYKDLPHVIQYTSDSEDAVNILNDVLYIIEDRYKTMETLQIRQWKDDHIYLIIDELADLMISPQSKQIKLKLQKILQIARACNVHVIACTQAPNRQVIPATLVLNFTNRVALRCLSAIESRQICNVKGAELLPQYGKGLYLSPKTGVTIVDIPITDDESINGLIYDWTVGKMLVKDEV